VREITSEFLVLAKRGRSQLERAFLRILILRLLQDSRWYSNRLVEMEVGVVLLGRNTIQLLRHHRMVHGGREV
jgi:hypothetical protein